LQIAKFNGLLSLRGGTGDAFAHRNALNHGHEGFWNATMRYKLQMTIRRVEAVERARHTAKGGDGLFKKFAPRRSCGMVGTHGVSRIQFFR
jgi:hypothetical protein